MRQGVTRLVHDGEREIPLNLAECGIETLCPPPAVQTERVLKETHGYWKYYQEAAEHTYSRFHFARGN
jgi:hypothetical protein